MQKVQHFSSIGRNGQRSKSAKSSPDNKTPPLAFPDQPFHFESDFQAFCKLQEQLDGLLAKGDLDITWQKVRAEYADSSPTEKYAIALALAEDHILNSFTAISVSDSTTKPMSTASVKPVDARPDQQSHFTQFEQVFADFLDSNVLLSIWNELDQHIPDEEKLEIASIFALDRLKEREHFRGPKRLATKSKSKSKKQRHKKNSQLTPQQECLAFVKSVFEAENISDLAVQLALQDRQYHVEDTIEHFCLLILKKGCFLRPNVSFADVVSTTTSSNHTVGVLEVPNKLTSSSSKAFSGAECAEEDRKGVLDRARCPPLLKASTEHEINLRVLEHIFKPKNPHIKCSLSASGEMRYEGTRELFSRDVYADIYLLSIRLDLHGLTVYHSLSMLESCLTYYYTAEAEGKLWGRAGSLKIVLVLIVGKGLHSEGQRARLGPAIVKYLQEWHIKDFVYYEGEITVQIKL